MSVFTHLIDLLSNRPWIEEPGRLQSMGLQRVGHNSATSLSHFSEILNIGHCKVKTVFGLIQMEESILPISTM